MYKKISLILLVLTIAACGGEQKKTTPPQEENIIDNLGNVELESTTDGRVDPSSLFTMKELEDLMGLDRGAVYEIIGDGGPNSRNYSAFYKIAEPEKGNAAIAISWISDPKVEGYETWADDFIENKMAAGVNTLQGDFDRPIKFHRVDIGGDIDAAFNAEQGMIYWHYPGKNWIGRVAFNITTTPEKMEATAITLAKAITKRVLS